MRIRAALVTVVAVPLALGLVACDNNHQPTGYRPSVPTDAPAAVTTKTTAPLKTARLNRVTFVPAMNTALGKQKTWRVVYTMAVNGNPLVTVSGVQTAKPVAMSMNLSGAITRGRTAKVIVVGNTLYMSAPGLTPAGKYLEATGADAAEVRSMVADSDPRKLSKALSSAATVKLAGTQSLGDEELDRYVATVDTVKATKTTKTTKAMEQQGPGDAPKTLVYEILMDSAHRVRQVHFESSGLSMNIIMSDYNKPVHITAPPASAIVK